MVRNDSTTAGTQVYQPCVSTWDMRMRGWLPTGFEKKIIRPAQRLEPDERRRALGVVVADVQGEAKFRPLGPTDEAAEKPKHVPEPPRLYFQGWACTSRVGPTWRS